MACSSHTHRQPSLPSHQPSQDPQTCEPHLHLRIPIGCDLDVTWALPGKEVWEPTWALTVLVDRATKCFATAEGYKRQSQVTPNPSQGPPEGSKPPIPGETEALGGTGYSQSLPLRLSRGAPCQGQEDRGVRPILPHRPSQAQVSSPVKWVWPWVERIPPGPRDLEVPSAS